MRAIALAWASRQGSTAKWQTFRRDSGCWVGLELERLPHYALAKTMKPLGPPVTRCQPSVMSRLCSGDNAEPKLDGKK